MFKTQHKKKIKKIPKSKNLHKLEKKVKKKIPKAIREQCWIKNFGNKFKCKCYINWCNNDINVFDFHVGHDLPESKGGSLAISNLKPICARCNLSMSNNYSIKEWNALQSTTCCVIC
jgi:5-methylcytosine-specific restriction endonuclease McrA